MDKLLQKQLKAIQSQLIQQEKLASLGQLTTGITHEIINPLNFVNSFSEDAIDLMDEALGKNIQLRNNPPPYELANPLSGSLAKYRRSMQRKQNSKDYRPKLKIKTISDNEKESIDIEDNGTGIPNDIKDKIMEPVFTTKKGTEGTALGLSIADNIIKAHGGKLSIPHSDQKGTTFRIDLLKKENL